MTDLRRPADAKTDMPVVADWIEKLRASLGKEWIDQAMRDGLRNGGFWAIENGCVIGKPPADEIRRAQRELDAAAREPRADGAE